MAQPTRHLYRRVEPPDSVSAQIQAISNPTGLPFRKHPIYWLRKVNIIIALVGIILSVISFGPFAEPLAASAGFLALSTLACAADLISYATKKVSNPDQDPKWPTKKWMLIDICLAIILQFVFWAAIDALSWSYYRNNVLGSYAALADLLCSLLHAWSFWKELMASYKAKWLAGLEKEPCARCGYGEESDDQEVPHRASNSRLANTFPYAGPSASVRQANVLTPGSPESAMEEGLLIGSDFDTSYGSTAPSERMIDEHEVVVCKGKKSRTAKDKQSKSDGKKPA